MTQILTAGIFNVPEQNNIMPVSKHYKNGQTARQFRKKRNLRRAASKASLKTKKLGMMRAMDIVEKQST